jgi:nucleoid-associated protein YgaU
MNIPKYAGPKRLLLMFGLIQICIFAFGAVTEKTGETLSNIRNNRYLAESLRLQALARQAFAIGDYDGAIKNADNAEKAAAASDLYVGQQVKIYTADNKMVDALERLGWADSAEAKRYFPNEFYDAKTYYNLGLIAKNARKWDDTIENANKVIKTLAAFTAPPETASVMDTVPVADSGGTAERIGITAEPALPERIAARQEVLPVEDDKKSDKGTPLPAQYTVRSWDKSGDCFWNIAGRSWVYGDPRRWPLLYQANKNRIPNPKNPDLIEEGMVMDIPSVNGEERNGHWSPDAVYAPLKK